jgi:hypothetical protein
MKKAMAGRSLLVLVGLITGSVLNFVVALLPALPEVGSSSSSSKSNRLPYDPVRRHRDPPGEAVAAALALVAARAAAGNAARQRAQPTPLAATPTPPHMQPRPVPPYQRPCTGGEGGQWVAGVPGPLQLSSSLSDTIMHYELDRDKTRHCSYKKWSFADAHSMLRKRGGEQIVFMGDSILRVGVYNTFWQKLLDSRTSVQLAKYRPTRWPARNLDSFMASYDWGVPGGFACQFLWAPYINHHNRGLGPWDTRHVYPYEPMIRSLRMDAGRYKLGDRAALNKPADNMTVKVFDREMPDLPGRVNESGAELCLVSDGRENRWERLCNPPSTVVVNFGLWQTEKWAMNAEAFESVLQKLDADNTGMKVIAVLGWPVRKSRSKIPDAGVQEDPNVEKQYKPQVLQKMRKRFAAICHAIRCCFVVDTWDAAYHRPEDSGDGRHYDSMTPVSWTTINLLLSAIEAPCAVA